jgi:hypothetical protein
MIAVTKNKGFQMEFENGWTISVQFGYGNYCDNYNHPEGYRFAQGKEIVSSSDAEIAIWDENGKWYNFGTDTVKGHCSADEVAEWIEKTKNFTK